MSIYIKNGTPVDGEPLCWSCEHVHMQRGFRESDEAVFCTYHSWDTPRPVRFRVRECTDYHDRNKPNRDWMETNALIVEAKHSVHEAGFRAEMERDEPAPSELVQVGE